MKITLFIIAFSLISLLGCNTTNPPDNGGGNGQDTTSHNFTWQTFQFGQHSSSVLYDVAIIDENNIYAVGEIYLNDSLGQADLEPYNLARWDGQKWDLNKIYYLQNGSTFINPIRSIFVFNENNIWFGNFTNWDGHGFKSIELNISFSSVVNKIWGTSSNNIYIVGNNGTMAHYNGSTWQKIESGTDLPIQDIWGALNPNTSKQEILCVASERSLNKGKKLLKIDGNTVTALPDSGLPWSLSSVWFISNEKYYIAGDGIYEKEKLNNEIWKNGPLDITTYYTYKIRGKKSNDIAAAGGVGEVLHYNGNSWKSYFSETKLSFGNYLSVDIKGDIIVAVGIDNPKAFIAFGKR